MNSLLNPIFSVINWLICIFLGFFYLVADGIIWALNMTITGLALIVAGVLAVLPAMPALPLAEVDGAPALPGGLSTAAGWVAWFWPIGTTVDIFAFIIAAWIVWLGVSIALRWAKALNA